MTKISKRVMELDKFDGAIFYRVAWHCDSIPHDLTIVMEKIPKGDKFDGELVMIFYADVCYNQFYRKYWFQTVMGRIKAALRIIIGKQVKFQQDFLIMDKEHIESFIQALQEGLEHIEQNETT